MFVCLWKYYQFNIRIAETLAFVWKTFLVHCKYFTNTGITLGIFPTFSQNLANIGNILVDNMLCVNVNIPNTDITLCRDRANIVPIMVCNQYFAQCFIVIISIFILFLLFEIIQSINKSFIFSCVLAFQCINDWFSNSL